MLAALLLQRWFGTSGIDTRIKRKLRTDLQEIARSSDRSKLIRGQFTTIDDFREQLRQALTPYKYES